MLLLPHWFLCRLLSLSLRCSHLAGHDWLLWNTLPSWVTAFGRGVPGHYPTHPLNAYTHTPFFQIWFAKYSSSHTLVLFHSISALVLQPTPFSFISHKLHTPSHTLPLVSRFDLHEILAYVSLHLRSSWVCVCAFFVLYVPECKAHANVSSWSLESDWRWQSKGGTLCGPANWATQMGGEKGETESCRYRQTDRRRGPPCSAPFHSYSFTLHFQVALHRSSSHYETSFCEYWFPYRQ